VPSRVKRTRVSTCVRPYGACCCTSSTGLGVFRRTTQAQLQLSSAVWSWSSFRRSSGRSACGSLAAARAGSGAAVILIEHAALRERIRERDIDDGRADQPSRHQSTGFEPCPTRAASFALLSCLWDAANHVVVTAVVTIIQRGRT